MERKQNPEGFYYPAPEQTNKVPFKKNRFMNFTQFDQTYYNKIVTVSGTAYFWTREANGHEGLTSCSLPIPIFAFLE
ncbi:MAG: hypothetical protein LBB53_05635 [Prevotellaceae bacterium]|nr:hypothetical protein [Prevotellaceae bacterium]